jgi:signal transduction histidine kinase
MLVREFDFYLETVAKTLAVAAEVDENGIALKLVPEALPDVARVEGELFSQYWTEEGAVLAKSTNLGGHNLLRPPTEADRPRVQSFALWDGRGARAAAVEFRIRPAVPLGAESPAVSPENGTTLTLVVARDTTDLESHVRQLRWLLLASGVATMSAAAIGSILVIRRSLRPLEDVAARIAALGEDDLSARIPAAAMPEEIVPLVERLNDLLHRLEQAFARERSLTADVAHELRTPVAGILSTVGVTLSSERTPSDYREALEDVRGIARQMRSMIENLLALMRLESGHAEVRQEPIELREMVAQTWQRCEKQAATRGLSFQNEVPEDFCCEADRSAFGIILANLLENAVQYADEHGRVWVTARHAGGFAEITVANTGCTLMDEQVARVFDRFWRADASRREATLHVGLGLPLVRRIAESLGGAITAEADVGGVFTVRVAWPPK